MASRIEIFDVTIPPGTPQSAPVTVPLPFDDGNVERIELRWPPGPAGLVGLRIRHSSQVVIPYSGTAWIVSNDEPIYWPVEGYPATDKWDVIGYNTGAYPHTIQVRLLITETVNPVVPVTLVTI
ncbi:MAG TPA: hypothetical protein VFU23_10980 [Gemmatimonadales bacterium]|nr:hypothetical protein [Gemmatimonadales bacterium]